MNMKKMVLWCFNYHDPRIWIANITGGEQTVMFAHLMDKWNRKCRLVDSTATAFLYFFLDIDKEYQDKLEKYIEENYKG